MPPAGVRCCTSNTGAALPPLCHRPAPAPGTLVANVGLWKEGRDAETRDPLKLNKPIS